jgi:1-acyl-sn-glycerol-3-phosphate acyltransferase
MNWRTLYYYPVYYGTLLLFAAGGLELAALSLLVPGNGRTERLFQRLIHFHFVWFLRWCAAVNLVHVRYEGMERIGAGRMVLVANHRSLFDVVCVVARLPEAVCVVKQAILRNPILGAARRAGYLGNDAGHEMVRRAVEQVARGQRLLIFPEGTRGPGGRTLPFKPGFALIARRAHAPIQSLRITTDSDLLTKGRPILRLPRFPAHITVTAGPVFASDGVEAVDELAAGVAAWYRDPVAAGAACAEPVPALS